MEGGEEWKKERGVKISCKARLVLFASNLFQSVIFNLIGTLKVQSM